MTNTTTHDEKETSMSAWTTNVFCKGKVWTNLQTKTAPFSELSKTTLQTKSAPLYK
jgi:hypothetical protein